jgi:hypothetical protein
LEKRNPTRRDEPVLAPVPSVGLPFPDALFGFVFDGEDSSWSPGQGEDGRVGHNGGDAGLPRTPVDRVTHCSASVRGEGRGGGGRWRLCHGEEEVAGGRGK